MLRFPSPSFLAIAAFALAACAPSAPAVAAGHPATPDAATPAHPVVVAALAPAPEPDLPAPLRPDSERPGGGDRVTGHAAMDYPAADAAEMGHAGMDHAAMGHAMPTQHAMPKDPAVPTRRSAPAGASGSTWSTADEPFPAALDAYLAVQAALASDQTDRAAAQAFAAAFAEATEGMPPADPHLWHSRSGEVTAVRVAAQQLAEASDLAAARLAFGALSVPFAALAEAHGVPGGYALARFTCGMASGVPEGGVWLQPDGELRNPYFGAAMLTCGRRDGALSETDGATQMDHGDVDHGNMDRDRP